MDDRDDVGGRRGERPLDRRRVARAPPLDVDARHRRAVALEDLRQAIAEVPGDDDEHAGPR